ncbi:MAG: GumC family protein [Methylobacteriaceae bacterium]|nr:GumC family protein [Methylobacteriaceae bacterium]
MSIFPREPYTEPPAPIAAATATQPLLGMEEPSIVGVLWHRRWIVILSVIACIAAGALYYTFAPRSYSASAVLLLDPHLGRGLGADPIQPGYVTDTSAIDSQVKLLTSQSVLKRVADSEHLEKDPDFNGENRSLLSRLTQPSRPPGEAVDLIALGEHITIKRPERTYVVEVQATASSGEKAARLANAIVHAYNEDQIDARVHAAESDSRWVRQKLADLETQIRAAENKVESYKSANRIVSTEGLRSNEQQVADLTKELGTARARASEAKSRLDQVQRIAKQGRIEASAEALRSPVIERLRTQQADSEREVARLRETLGARHPALVEAQAQNARVKALIRDELTRIQTGVEAEYNAARANAASLEHQIDQLKAQSNVTSQKLVPLKQLEREVEVLRASYDRFAKIQDTLTQQESESPPARIIATARPPLSPASPRRLVVGLLSLGGGLFLGLGLALLTEHSARSRAANRGFAAARREPNQAPMRRRFWNDA